MNVVVGLVSIRIAIPSQTSKILNKISLRYFRDANSFSFGMQLPKWGEKWLYTVGWVGECFSELDAPIAIPWSDTKECFVRIF